MSEKDYQEMIEDNLKRLNAQIDKAKAKSGSLSGETKREYERTITFLQDKEKNIKTMLKELKQKKGSKVIKQLEKRIDGALAEIQNGVANLMSSVDSRVNKSDVDRSKSGA
jgi:hypothetical protein